MKRRDFLKLLAASPALPSVLCTKEKPTLTLDKEVTDFWDPVDREEFVKEAVRACENTVTYLNI